MTRTKPLHRLLSFALAFVFTLALLPAMTPSPRAAVSNDRNALDALGIDTSIAPDGFNENETGNPYGKNTVTINPVLELAETRGGSSYLYGHAETLSGQPKSVSNALTAGATATSGMTVDGRPVLYAAAVGGNFSGATDGTAAQRAFVGVVRGDDPTGFGSDSPSEMEYNIVLFFCDANSQTASSYIMLSKDFWISRNDVSGGWSAPSAINFQSYLQITAGDYDNDGYDEVAVYAPGGSYIGTTSRILVYKLNVPSGAAENNYLDAGQWEMRRGYTLSTKSEDYAGTGYYINTFNHVSLLSGDFNRDGACDLAFTYGLADTIGYISSKAVILSTGAGGSMLWEETTIPTVLPNGDKVARAAFAWGDITGSGENSLILGGQLTHAKQTSYAKNDRVQLKDLYSRYLAVYNYAGKSGGKDVYTEQYADNYILFEKDSGDNYTHSVMSGSGDKFYSLPGRAANMAVMTRGKLEKPQLYFDGLIFESEGSGIVIADRRDTSYNQPYLEYGAQTADMIGNGYDALALGVILTGYNWDANLNLTSSDCNALNNADRSRLVALGSGSTGLIRVLWDSETEQQHKQTVGSLGTHPMTFAFVNTDRDTSYIEYTGEHYFMYSDPKVLAAIAAPPTFGDLVENDGLSGNYTESTTSYGSSKGSGGGSTNSHTLTLGAFVNYDKAITVFGVQVARVFMETEVTGGCTWEYEQTSTLTHGVEYSTSAGKDSVAFYSIPLEIYGYKAYSPDENGNYVESNITISIPHNASVSVLELDEYERIAADYAELPQLLGTVFTHDPRQPATYPASAPKNAIVYNGDWAAVGYSSTAGGASQTQTLSKENSSTSVYTSNVEIETKLGGGAGSLAVGIVGGYAYGGGSVEISMSGEDFAGSMQNMPIEAQAYGYGYNWKLFAYTAELEGSTFPVVNYMVSDVMSPPALPVDFAQDVALTTSTAIGMSWSTDTMVAGFSVYRYYDFPDGNGDIELAFVPMNEGVRGEDGRYYFSYVDDSLSPYETALYSIQTLRSNVPSASIPGAYVSMRSTAAQGYPQLSISGDKANWDSGAGTLYIYPDAVSTATVTVANAADYNAVLYQWQKLSDGKWVDVANQTARSITFSESGLASEGRYRCRVNVMFGGKAISAYTEAFTAQYNMRMPVVVDALTADVDANGKPVASVSLKSVDPAHNALPSGYVTFRIIGVDYEQSYTVALKTEGDRAVARLASVPADKIAALPEGAYTITAGYNGSRVFRSLPDLGAVTVLSGAEGWILEMSTSYDSVKGFQDAATAFEYGDIFYFRVSKVETSQSGASPAISSAVYREDGVLMSGSDLLETEGLTMLVSGGWHDSYYHRTFTDLPYTLSDADGPDWENPIGALEVKLCDAEDKSNVAARLDILINPRNVLLSMDDIDLEYNAGYAENINDNYDAHLELAAFFAQHRYTTSGLGTRPVLWGEDDTLTYWTKYRTDKFVQLRFGLHDGTVAYTLEQLAPGPLAILLVNNDNSISIYDGQKTHTIGKFDAYYTVQQTPVTLNYVSPLYGLTIDVPKVGGVNPGTVSVVEPVLKGEDGSRFSGGSTLVFQASPTNNYEVSKWEVYTTASLAQPDPEPVFAQQGGNRLFYTSKAEDITVRTTFKTIDATMTVSSNPASGGVYTLPRFFTNGGTVVAGTGFSSTATANPGYTFAGWDFVTGGTSTQSLDGVPNADGSNTVTVIMPGAHARLVAKFSRDKVTVTAGSNLQGSFEELLPSGETVTTTFTGEKLVPGDTVITFSPIPGRQLETGGTWSVDNIDTGETGSSFVWTATKSAVITAPTVAAVRTLKLTQPTNGRITLLVNGTQRAVPADGITVGSDSTLVLTLTPDYGYQAADASTWLVNGTALAAADGSETLTLTALDVDTTVSAGLEARTSVSFPLNTEGNGRLSYILYDHEGREQTTGLATGSEAFYLGDSLALTAAPGNDGVSMRGWTVDGSYADGAQTSRTVSVQGDRGVTAHFALLYPASTGVLTFRLEGDSGASISAVAVGASTPYAVTSGETIVLGSTVTLTASLPGGFMVDRWEIDGSPVSQNGNTHLNAFTLDMEGDAEVILYVTTATTVAVDSRGSNAATGFTGLSGGDAVTGGLVTATITPDRDYTVTDFYLENGSGTVYPKDGAPFISYSTSPAGIVTCSFYAVEALTLVAETGYTGTPITVDAETPVLTTNLSTSAVSYSQSQTAASLVVAAVVNDGGTLSYQWYTNTTGSNDPGASTPIDGAIDASCTPSTGTVGTAYYFVVVTNSNPGATGAKSAGVTSHVARVNVTDAVTRFLVSFDANGGTASETSRSITAGSALGTLPTATRGGFTFAGWFTDITGGSQIGSDTVPTGPDTYYARWTENGAGVTDTQAPVFTVNLSPASVSYDQGQSAATLRVTAAVTDGGALSYQWYTNTTGSNDPVASTLIDGATGTDYTPSTGTVGTAYYFAVATNSNPGATGAKSAATSSNAACITVTAPGTAYRISFDANGGTVSETSRSITPGAALGTLPTATRSSYSFNGWYTLASGGSAVTAATVPTGSTTYYAQWTANAGTGDPVNPGNTGGTGTATTPTPGETTLVAKTDDGTKTGSVPITVVQDGGNTEIKLDSGKVQEILKSLPSSGGGNTPAVTFDLSTVKGTETASLPAAAAQALGEAGVSMTIVLPGAEITIAPETLAAMSGKTVTVEATTVPQSALTGMQAAQVNDLGAVVNIEVFADGKKVDVPMVVSIPYTLKPNEDPKGVCLWFLDDEGGLTKIPAAYDPETGLLTATLEHQSLYVVGYDPVALWINVFSDIAEGAWYYDAVAWAEMNGLMNGVGDGQFSPTGGMTRAMFTQVLWNMEGTPEAQGGNPFGDVSGDAWYAGAVTWAYSQGIVNGVGADSFAPEKQITRQEMMVMLRNYAAFKGYALPVNRQLMQWRDKTNIDVWAQTAVEDLYKAGVINHKGDDNVGAKDTATRAEAATMLRSFIRFVSGK